MYDINKESIESLEFKFICHNEELDNDYTFSRPSKSKENYLLCLVWQPDDKTITICHHTFENNQMFDIERLYRGMPNSIHELYVIIDSLNT